MILRIRRLYILISRPRVRPRTLIKHATAVSSRRRKMNNNNNNMRTRQIAGLRFRRNNDNALYRRPIKIIHERHRCSGRYCTQTADYAAFMIGFRTE